jgi:hypothetical protein
VYNGLSGTPTIEVCLQLRRGEEEVEEEKGQEGKRE